MAIFQADEARHPVLAEVDAWLRQGADLRAKLTEEQKQLVERLKEIEAALAAIPRAAEPVSTPPTLSEQPARTAQISTEPEPLGASLGHERVADLVRRILESKPGGLTATNIIEAARQVNPDLLVPTIHSALHRFKAAGIVRVEGPRGVRMYILNRKGSFSINAAA
jgi:hypothetical protein